MRLLFLFLSSCAIINGLFEDQIGKFDWSRKLVGCPNLAFFDRSSKSDGDHILVSSKDDVLASISLTSGEIEWRRLLEKSDSHFIPPVIKDSNVLYTVTDNGRLLRAFNKFTGVLIWQQTLSTEVSPFSKLSIYKESVIVALPNKVLSFSSLKGNEEWSISLNLGTWTELISTPESLILATIDSGKLTVRSISDGIAKTFGSVNLKTKDSARCSVVVSAIACADSNIVEIFDLLKSPVNIAETQISFTVRSVDSLGSDYFAVRGASSAAVFGVDGRQKPLPNYSSYENIPVHSMFSDIVKNEIEIYAVYEDCRTELLVVSLGNSLITSEWIREEALARISSVEMVDLPLSESQQMIEDEFDEQGGSAIGALVHRVVSQIQQLQRWIARTVSQAFAISHSMVSLQVLSISDLLDIWKTSTAKVAKNQQLERDYFNLRKMIVITSLDGVVYGIDSAYGSIVWRHWLEGSFTPLESSLSGQTIPLFIQRSTAHYQLNGQAVVLFKNRISGNGVLLFLNPITGEKIERKELSSQILKADILPFTDKVHIHSLMVINKRKEVEFYPPIPSELLEKVPPVHVIFAEDNTLEGAVVNFKKNALETTWSSNLNLAATEKIISVKGKPAHQKVHSQGRVLIDRNVQYKYSNPNLAAIAALDKANELLSIILLDSVSGQVIHTARLSKATAPVHLVHCENWIVYSYWSEKSRRTEIGVIELYEGDTQSTTDKFDSLTPTRHAPQINEQGYVYAQGVEALAVTETEQGLTTRSLLFALPFGGIHEVSRKFLDANRPLELTQEMREEMMIPYMPELPIATEDMVNYNQTVHRVRGIKTSMSGLESTSLMLAYGLDLFFTRLAPSGTFDILKDDFDHILISLVLIGLFVGSYISKRISRNNSLKAQWA